MVKNIFHIPKKSADQEIFETLLKKPNIMIERIVSCGQVTEKDKWYDQRKEEWVILLSGNAKIEFLEEEISMEAGDYIYIPAHCKHRVTYTSTHPACIWLAIHWKDY